MRNRWFFTLLVVLALTLAGCAGLADLTAQPTSSGPASSVTATAQPTATAPAAVQPKSTKQGSPAPLTANSNETATAAVQAVIQKANEEQQQAFAKRDPSLMKDTATSGYYQELVKINADMVDGGVTDIKLVKTEYGPVTLTDATTAQTTTFETWQTTLDDGSNIQSRDRNVYTLVLEQGVWKIQSDEHPDDNQSTSPASTIPSRPSATPAPSGAAPSTLPVGRTDISRNWSGYAATGGSYSAVSGTWVVSQSNSIGTTGTSATWVGIGGVSGRDLIQAGTMQTNNGSGAARYSAWIEKLSEAARTVPLAVKPGDSVTASLTRQQPDEWLITLTNNTTGNVYQKTETYNSSLLSAEWIQEAPSMGRRIATLDDFDMIAFTGGSAVKDGKTVTIAEAGAKPVALSDSQGSIVASPSALTGDGRGFSVQRAAPVPAAQPQPRLPSRRGVPAQP